MADRCGVFHSESETSGSSGGSSRSTSPEAPTDFVNTKQTRVRPITDGGWRSEGGGAAQRARRSERAVTVVTLERGVNVRRCRVLI